MKKKNIDLYKNVKKNLEHFIEVHSYDIDKPKDNAKQDIRNFIEKMAVWFELRYPDSEIKKIFGFTNTEVDVTKEIFYNNPNLADILKNSMTEIDLKWHDFYNYDAFYTSLSEEEKRFIKEPCYPDLVFLYRGKVDHVHLSPEGYVEMYESTTISSGYISIVTDEYKNCNIEKFIKVLEEKGKPIDSNSEVYKAINSYDNQNRLRNNIIPANMKSTLIQLNIADDYFKAKAQVEKLERDMELKDRELYDLKHDLISNQIKTEGADERIRELEAENRELLLNKARLEATLEDALLEGIGSKK